MGVIFVRSLYSLVDSLHNQVITLQKTTFPLILKKQANENNGYNPANPIQPFYCSENIHSNLMDFEDFFLVEELILK